MTFRTFQEPALSLPSFSKIVLICAASVCLAAAPAAFAQRGGGHVGGHVSGAHFGGFGRGHASVGGAVPAARGSRAAVGSAGAFRSGGVGRAVSGPRSAYEMAAMESRSGASTRGYSREVFVPESGTRQFLPPSTRFVSANGGTSAMGSRTLAADNYFWEEPPQQARPAPVQSPRPVMPLNQMPRPMMMPPQQPLNMPVRSLARPLVPRPIYIPLQRNPSGAPAWYPNPVAMPPIARPMARPLVQPLQNPLSANRSTPLIGMTPAPRPFVFPQFHPFHPMGSGFGARPCFEMIGDCDFEFGFGFGSPFFFPPSSFGFGCFSFFNPCGIGFGPFGFGFGDFYYGYGWGNGWFYSPAPEIPPAPVNPTESNPPPDYSTGYFYLPEVPYSEPMQTAPKSTVKLVLKDGTIFDVYSYWLQDNRLYYVTTYNIKTSIPLNDLDLQKTVDLNQKLGVAFTLSNKPPDQQQPPDQQPPDGRDYK